MRQAMFGTAKRISLDRTRSTARQTARWSFRCRETSYSVIRSSSYGVGMEISEQSASTQANFEGQAIWSRPEVLLRYRLLLQHGNEELDWKFTKPATE